LSGRGEARGSCLLLLLDVPVEVAHGAPASEIVVLHVLQKVFAVLHLAMGCRGEGGASGREDRSGGTDRLREGGLLSAHLGARTNPLNHPLAPLFLSQPLILVDQRFARVPYI
jgi:hypothetical protein